MSWKKGKSREARGKKNILLSITQMSRLKYLPNVLRKIVHRTKTRYCFPFLNGSFHGAFFFQAWNAEALAPSLQQLSITQCPKSTYVPFALLEHLSDLFLFGSQSSVKATIN